MKTLNEIIEVVEERNAHFNWVGCFHCHYFSHVDCVDGCVLDYALRYLKEYRMMMDDIVAKRKKLESEIARYQEAVKNCETAENKYRKAEQDALKALDDWASRPVEENKKLVLTVDNPPLTWDELRTMEGKPVWVETFNRKDGRWVIFLRTRKWRVDPCEIAIFSNMSRGGSTFYRDNYGKTWQAYRKERTE